MGVGVGVPIGVGGGVSSGEAIGVSDFPIIGIGANESREDDGTGSDHGEKRLHFFFFSNRLWNRSDNVKATFAMGRGSLQLDGVCQKQARS